MTVRQTSQRLIAAAVAAAVIVLVAAPDAHARKDKDEPKKSSEPVFYPAPPDAPRLQFLTSFSNGKVVGEAKKKKRSSFAKWLTGASDESGGPGDFASPYGLAAHNGSLYICDVGSNKVHVLDFRQNEYRNLEGRILNPVNITIDADGTKYLCDTERRAILVYDAGDKPVREIPGPGTWTPIDLAFHGDNLLVADVTGGKVHVLTKSGDVIKTIGTKGMGPDELGNPTNLEVGPDGRIYVTDTLGQAVKVFNMEGQYVGAIGGPGATVGRFARPKGIAIDPQGLVYVVDTQWSVVQIFTPDGKVLLPFGQTGSGPEVMGMPATVTVDKSCMQDFSALVAPNFQVQYLVFVVNQFGKHKVGVYAFGRDKTLSADQYEIDMKKVEAAQARAKAAAEAAEAAEAAKTAK